jgi:hypothetical protein
LVTVVPAPVLTTSVEYPLPTSTVIVPPALSTSVIEISTSYAGSVERG